MCGSYRLNADDSETIKAILDEISRRHSHDAGYVQEHLLNDKTVYPDTRIPLICDRNESSPDFSLPGLAEVDVALMQWGFPSFSGRRSVINSRVETASSKPLFADSMASRRCLVPVSGFYEWSEDKKRYLFTLPGDDTLFLAGIYSEFDGRMHCCVLTTAANASVLPVHDRMPLVLTRDTLESWLKSPEEAKQLLTMTPPSLSMEAVPAEGRAPMRGQESLWGE